MLHLETKKDRERLSQREKQDNEEIRQKECVEKKLSSQNITLRNKET
jgi:hypothetical protein